MKFSNINRIKTAPRVLSFFLLGIEDGDFEMDAEYQRDYVWSAKQQQELMTSIFKGLPIGAVSIIEKHIHNGPYIEIVDGKQRVTTLDKYFKNEFPYINAQGESVYFKDLELIEQRMFKNSIKVAVNVLAEDISLIEKYQYFHAINFSGVPQSDEHKQLIEFKIKSLSDNKDKVVKKNKVKPF